MALIMTVLYSDLTPIRKFKKIVICLYLLYFLLLGVVLGLLRGTSADLRNFNTTLHKHQIKTHFFLLA